MNTPKTLRAIHIESQEYTIEGVSTLLELLGIHYKSFKNNQRLSLEKILEEAGKMPDFIISAEDRVGELGLNWLVKIRAEISKLLETGELDEAQKPLLILHSSFNFTKEEIQTIRENDIQPVHRGSRGKSGLHSVMVGYLAKKTQTANAA
ncbi:MAG: hypothetical protein PHO48_02970 [Candidatus Gracilibacteria bacterium]|nr:hypothetical protein [Candidatus Gracilibacteria bacterium]MDD5179046.1 hypothetical protein [Candidatus Gracilibacteria bacterium]